MAQKKSGKSATSKNTKKDPAFKQKVLLHYTQSESLSETAKAFGMAVSTLHSWVNDPEFSETLENVRKVKKETFAEMASTIIDKGLALLDRRISTALDHENELEHLINEIWATDPKELTQQQKTALTTKIKSLELQKASEITTAIGTLFDKRALARGETTANTAFEVNIKVVD